MRTRKRGQNVRVDCQGAIQVVEIADACPRIQEFQRAPLKVRRRRLHRHPDDTAVTGKLQLDGCAPLGERALVRCAGDAELDRLGHGGDASRVSQHGGDVGVVLDDVHHGLLENLPERLDALGKAVGYNDSVRDGVQLFWKEGRGKVGAHLFVSARAEEVQGGPSERRADHCVVGIVVVERVTITLVRPSPQRGEPGQRFAILGVIHQVVDFEDAHGQQPRQKRVDVGRRNVAGRRDGDELSRWMATFAEGGLALSEEALEQTKSMFDSHRCSDDETCEEIAQVWSSNGYLIDPHTAIGTKAAKVCHGDSQAAMVTLATAHPAKFPAAIEASGIGVEAQLPSHLADLFERPEAFDVLPNDLTEVQTFMAGNCRA